MFYGLASGKVPTGDLELVHVLSDIETLNRAAFDGKYEISAVSFHAYAHLTDKYILLPHGASMGDDYGPMVVVRNDWSRERKARRRAGPARWRHRGNPGTLTTAFLALRLYKPDVQYVVMPFDEILEAVRDGKVEAGLLIHEGQLTYAQEGLRKIVDFGEWWAERTGGLPLPLGGNIIRRDLGPELIARLSRLLHDSIAYGLDPSRRRGHSRHAVRPRPRPRRHGHLRRHVRERPHARLRRARQDGRAAAARRGGREGAHPARGRRLRVLERQVRRRRRDASRAAAWTPSVSAAGPGCRMYDDLIS